MSESASLLLGGVECKVAPLVVYVVFTSFVPTSLSLFLFSSFLTKTKKQHNVLSFFLSFQVFYFGSFHASCGGTGARDRHAARHQQRRSARDFQLLSGAPRGKGLGGHRHGLSAHRLCPLSRGQAHRHHPRVKNQRKPKNKIWVF